MNDKLQIATAALQKIANWELPETGKFWIEKANPKSYEDVYGSNGARDYIKSVAKETLEKLK